MYYPFCLIYLGALRYSSALDKITRSGVPNIPVAGISKVLNNAHRHVLYNPDQFEDLPPLTPEQLDSVIQFWFPDSCKSGHRYDYPSSYNAKPSFDKESVSSLLVSTSRDI
jgi:hypothetical protein